MPKRRSRSDPLAGLCLLPFLLVVGGHDAVTYDDGAWSAPNDVTEGDLESVSCPTAFSCVAIAEGSSTYGHLHYGYALSYNGATWSSPTEMALGPGRAQSGATSVSCPSSSFCAALSREGEVSLYEEGEWSAWSPLGDSLNSGATSMSCSSADFCAAVDEAGQVFTYAGATSRFPLSVFITGDGEVVSPPQRIACASAECRYEPEGEVTLVATNAGAGYEFAGWVGCSSVAGAQCGVSGASNVTALFVKATETGSRADRPAK